MRKMLCRGFGRHARRQLVWTGTILVVMCVSLQLLNTVNFIAKDGNRPNTADIHSHILKDSTIPETRIPTEPQKEDNNDVVNEGVSQFRTHPSIAMHVNTEEALLYGHFRNYTSYLTIGIPSVQRKGVSYLEATLDSLIKHSDQADKRDVTLIIFLADKEHDVIETRAKQIYQKYKHHVDSGYIQIVHPDHQYYPDFRKLERTFNDSETRVEWRSKQNIDYAYMFLYSRNISQHYMQLEDDVVTTNNYVKEIKKFIMSRPPKPKWFCLQFSHLGFIGKLFNSDDLKMIAEYILMFYSEQPGDLLLNYLKRIKTQWKDILRKPSLFQHQGVISSLKDKRQLLVDKSFGNANNLLKSRKKYYTNNPHADIYTTIDIYENYKPEFAYDLSDKQFWGVTPNRGDYFRISFHAPQNITHLYIKTGTTSKPADILRDGAVKIAINDASKQSTQEACDTSQMIGTFKNGVFDSKNQNITLPINVGCVSIEVTKSQKSWLIIKEISVVTAKR